MRAESRLCRGPFASRAGSGYEGHAKRGSQPPKKKKKKTISLQTVVAYPGIRAFANDMRFERDECLCRANVVALEEILRHKRHSDQVEARD